MKKYKSLSLLLWMSVFPLPNPNPAVAQTAADTSEVFHSENLLKTIGGDFLHVFSSPLRLTKNDGLRLLTFSAVAGGLVGFGDDHFDEEYAKESHHGILYPFKQLAEVGQIYDDVSPVYFTAGVSGAALVGGLILKDRKLVTTGRLVLEAAVMTQILTGWAKGVFGRPRPYTDRGAKHFDLFKFSNNEDFKSLPSGHVSSVFSTMTVLTKQYEVWWVEIPAYTIAVAVAFQRMNSRNHWFSDTVVGGALGYCVGSTLMNRYSRQLQHSSFTPDLQKNRLGLMVTF
ncbi:MAG: phosphatase PAP2 family protein [candidate division KSB1 bacterium]|nr:phosphatase PAP2 family protein [candidate division KSB1 bacterium]MDZ7364333.1 phosphatase PAP2 family protein [candidate division KSB1 bacterium]MDZ7402705.1 phosphatase PAP2 family protein [candidate division KSB1 bacterium]